NTGSVTGTGAGVTGTGGVIGNINGGTVGHINPDLSLSADFNLLTTAGGVTGVDQVGGLVGIFSPSVYEVSAFTTFRNAGSVTGTGSGTGGIGGVFGSINSASAITIANNLSNSGTVHGFYATAVGGIMGAINIKGILTGLLTNTGTIEGNGNVGGLFGE